MTDLERILLEALDTEEMKANYYKHRNRAYNCDDSEQREKKIVGGIQKEIEDNLNQDTISTGNNFVDKILKTVLGGIDTETLAQELYESKYKPTWGRNGKQKTDADRPLTNEEKEHVAKYHNLIYAFCRDYGINPNDDDNYGMLVDALMYATKKFLTDQPELQKYSFTTCAYSQMRCVMSNKYRAKRAKSRVPKDCIVSLDYEVDDSRLNSEGSRIEAWWIDTKMNVERQVIEGEMYQEFRNTIADMAFGEDSLKVVDLLLYGMNKAEVVREMKKTEDGACWNREMLDYELARLRKVFKEVFGF